MQRSAGVVGVDMNLDDFIVVHQHQAVADAAQELPELLRVVLVLPGDDELGAVGKGDVLGVEVGEVSLLLHFARGTALGCYHILALQGTHHGFQRQQPALAAGIHHAGLFQHRVLVDGVGQRHFGFLDGSRLDKFDKVILLGSLGGLGGSQTGNGQDGALGGLHDGLVSCIHATLQGIGPQHAVADLVPLEGLGDAAHQQGQNHAGVAASAPQHGGGRNLRGGVQLRVLRFAQVGCGRVDGHGDIGAGVSVGNRENVQFVQRLLVNFDGCSSADNHPAQLGTVNGLPQFLYSSTFQSIIMESMNTFTALTLVPVHFATT